MELFYALIRFSKDDETNASLVQNFLNEGLDLKVVRTFLLYFEVTFHLSMYSVAV